MCSKTLWIFSGFTGPLWNTGWCPKRPCRGNSRKGDNCLARGELWCKWFLRNWKQHGTLWLCFDEKSQTVNLRGSPSETSSKSVRQLEMAECILYTMHLIDGSKYQMVLKRMERIFHYRLVSIKTHNMYPSHLINGQYFQSVYEVWGTSNTYDEYEVKERF